MFTGIVTDVGTVAAVRPLREGVGLRIDTAYDPDTIAIGASISCGGVCLTVTALPELLEDLAALGMASVLVEGGAKVAGAFLADGLVDRIILFQGPEAIGKDGIASPIDANHIPAGFRKLRAMQFGEDSYAEWIRNF